MKNYKMVELMLKQDFEIAKANHDFSGMTDDYELLRELWATGEWDSEDYHDNKLTPLVHCFAEIEENKVLLPSNIKWCATMFDKRIIYALDHYAIKLVLQGVDNDLIFDYFRGESLETKYIILNETLRLDEYAMEVLELNNGDVVELCISEEMIAIMKQ